MIKIHFKTRFWKDLKQIPSQSGDALVYEPKIDEEEREKLSLIWKNAIESTSKL
jgi:glycerol kinase